MSVKTNLIGQRLSNRDRFLTDRESLSISGNKTLRGGERAAVGTLTTLRNPKSPPPSQTDPTLSSNRTTRNCSLYRETRAMSLSLSSLDRLSERSPTREFPHLTRMYLSTRMSGCEAKQSQSRSSITGEKRLSVETQDRLASTGSSCPVLKTIGSL